MYWLIFFSYVNCNISKEFETNKQEKRRGRGKYTLKIHFKETSWEILFSGWFVFSILLWREPQTNLIQKKYALKHLIKLNSTTIMRKKKKEACFTNFALLFVPIKDAFKQTVTSDFFITLDNSRFNYNALTYLYVCFLLLSVSNWKYWVMLFHSLQLYKDLCFDYQISLNK